jgi:hypothetical protein
MRWLGLLTVVACKKEPDPCDPDPCADLPGTTCLDGLCVDGSLDIEVTDDGVTGTLTFTSGDVATFTASRVAEGSGAATITAGGASVTASVADDALALDVGALTVDGLGALTPDEQAAVDALATGPLADALALVPLQLGCAPDAASVPLDAVAALLAPWQAVLKYNELDRASKAQEMAARSGCAYFADSDGSELGRPLNHLVQLSYESPLPTVFGVFPFDADGEAVDPTRAAGDVSGPCRALCRGACGADCEPVNCDQEVGEQCDVDVAGNPTGYVIATLTHVCGTATGCQEHDDCYDLCNQQYACGSWDAAYCRRGCDDEAIGRHGFQTCLGWAQGLGPFSATLRFPIPVEGGAARLDPAACPLVIGATQWQEEALPAPMTQANAVTYCQDLVVQGHDDWYLPSISELHSLVRGCSLYDCSPVDYCYACPLYGGPEQHGCYWDNRFGGRCDNGYWSSSQFAYQGNYKWMELFFTGGSAAGYEGLETYVRCARLTTP